MKLKKICPDCGVKYVPRIEKCADCGAVLLYPEEFERAKKEKERLREQAVEKEAVVRRGDLDWLSELRSALIEAAFAVIVDRRTAYPAGRSRSVGRAGHYGHFQPDCQLIRSAPFSSRRVRR